MELTCEIRRYKRLMAEVRIQIVNGNDEETCAALKAVEPYLSQISPFEKVDLLERACLWSSKEIVDTLFDTLAPFVYRGWALALALRSGREEIARDLLRRGVDLLEDPTIPLGTPNRDELVRRLTRGGLTEVSKELFENPFAVSVTRGAFVPPSNSEALLGANYSRGYSIVTTVALIEKIASEGRFSAVVFDDLLRTALLLASSAHRNPASYPPETAESCLTLARALLKMCSNNKGDTERIDAVAARFITPDTDENTMAFICECAPQVFYQKLAGADWLQKNTDLVRAMVNHLTPGTQYQNGVLLRVLARGACLDELKEMRPWKNTFTSANINAAIDAASEAGHAEVAAWLLTVAQGVNDSKKGAAAHAKPQAKSDQDERDDRDDLGDLSDLLL